MLTIRLVLPALLLLMILLATSSFAVAVDSTPDARAKKFVTDYEARIRPLEVAMNLLWWSANTTGKDEDYEKKGAAQNRLDEALADKKAFKELREIYEDRKKISDKILARTIEVLYLIYLEKQVEPSLLKKIEAKSTAAEQAFITFRAKIDGQELTDSEVRRVLKESKNSERRQKVWEASKEVGQVVAKDLKELVKLRNEAARQLGFKNYHQLQLFLNEQNTDDVLKLFDQIDDLTRVPFKEAKAEIDAKLAADCNVKVDQLMPWHYHDPFFQDSPAVFAANLDAPYRKADIVKLSRDFYAGIGLPLDDVIARSDLYEKPCKNPHAFCMDIDREGNVRVLANIVPNEYWASTALHELAHSVYSSKNIPASLPYALRAESHILTTEGVAMLFERFPRQRAWIEQMGLAVENPREFDDTAAKMQRNKLLIYARWCQVMLRFEKGMYEDPDQDLSKLWWDLVEKYQLLIRPQGRTNPDYASKIHIVISPVYYHNYLMGQLFASQLHRTITKEVLKETDPATAQYIGNKKVGAFFKEKVFVPGRLLAWNELTQFATGSELSPQAFGEDLKK